MGVVLWLIVLVVAFLYYFVLFWVLLVACDSDTCVLAMDCLLMIDLWRCSFMFVWVLSYCVVLVLRVLCCFAAAVDGFGFVILVYS